MATKSIETTASQEYPSVLSPEDSRALFDHKARAILGISGPEFLRRALSDGKVGWPAGGVRWATTALPGGVAERHVPDDRPGQRQRDQETDEGDDSGQCE